MKKLLVIVLTATLLLVLFVVQNPFLPGLLFMHAGSEMSTARNLLGDAEYNGDIGFTTNQVYFVRLLPVIIATVNVNFDSQGHYSSDGKSSALTHQINWIKWKWIPCFDRKYAVNQSLSQPDHEPSWK